MAEDHDSLAFLMKAAANRAPGKRTVRVVPRDKFVDFAGGDDDDEDLDYSQKSGEEESDEDRSDVDDDSGSSESGSDSDSDEEEDGSNNSGSNFRGSEVRDDNEESNMSLPTTSQASGSGFLPGRGMEGEDGAGGLVCSLCLNLREVSPDEGGMDIIQCDKCGLTVHESCYGILDTESDEQSDGSENLTEPWFCEPCLGGLQNPPHCELCPNRGGAMKRTDTRRWVHLLCALYIGGTNGITFGDVDLLSPASLSELNIEKYGLKPCSLCVATDKLQARTGVCVKCDAGLCKTYFHVTCGQGAGLLVDSGGAGEGVADPFYGLCHGHSLQSLVKKKRKRYWMVQQQQKEWAAKNRNKVLSEREERKLREKRDALERKISRMDILQPQEKHKTQRLLHTSAEFLHRLQHKSEFTAGIHKEDFDKEFRGGFTADMVGKIQMPVAFSADFCKYHAEREKYIARMGKRVQDLRKSTDKLKAEQVKSQEHYDKVEKEEETLKGSLDSNHKRVVRLCDFLTKTLGWKNVKYPEALKKHTPESAKIKKKPPSLGARIVTSKGKQGFRQNMGPSTSRIEIHPCGTCQKSHDQHLLAHCDTCEKFFHLGCLDPPLTKGSAVNYP